MHYVGYICQFIQQWLGPLSHVIFIFLGILIGILVIVGLWDRRIRFFGACMGSLLSLFLIFYPQIASKFLHFDILQRVSVLLILSGCTLFLLACFSLYSALLHVRDAALWIGFSIFLILLGYYPFSVSYLSKETVVLYYILVGVVCIGFLALMLFYFSLILTRLERRYDHSERPHCKGPIDSQSYSIPTVKRSEWHRIKEATIIAWKTFTRATRNDVIKRNIRGTRIAAPAIIFFTCVSVLAVGLSTHEAMIGDEVTHYFMLVEQSHDISKPNFFAAIPLATGGVETRRYPHSFLWHYFGALAYRLTGNSFAGVQLYQTFFLFQLLGVAYLLAASRGGAETRSALIYVLTLSSLPLTLIFSVAFYQDVPVTAQILTAFYLLRKNKWFPASCFIALAIGFKETAILFFPAFFILLFCWGFKRAGMMKSVCSLICSLLVVLGFTYGLGKAVNIYAHSSFYPQEKLKLAVSVAKSTLNSMIMGTRQESSREIIAHTHTSSQTYSKVKTAETAPQIIANNPGDLRIKQNYFVYGGILLWLVTISGILIGFPYSKKLLIRLKLFHTNSAVPSESWLYFTGGSFLVLAAYFGREAPDARFFLPGLPFLLLPCAEQLSRLKKTKILICLFATLAILQTGYVLAKTYTLREVSPAIKEGIAYLVKHPPTPARIFMYPEGNYRLFPVEHEWYLGYRLREFWRANDDERIKMLRQFNIGAIVIKKHLIAPVDKEITNLGVYPPEFVHELLNDPRFAKIFENEALLIFLPPPADHESK